MSEFVGLDVETGLNTITPEAIAFVMDNKPYIEMVNEPVSASILSHDSPINRGDLGDPSVLETDCGWTLHYYPPKKDRPARLRLGKEEVPGKVEAELAELTIEHQTMRTAIELFKIMIDQGWGKFKIVNGTERLKWSVWAVVTYNNEKLTGYSPKGASKEKFDQVNGEVLELMHKEVVGEKFIHKSTSKKAVDSKAKK